MRTHRALPVAAILPFPTQTLLPSSSQVPTAMENPTLLVFLLLTKLGYPDIAPIALSITLSSDVQNPLVVEFDQVG